MDAFIAGFCKVQFLCYDDGYDGASPTKSSTSYMDGYEDGDFDADCDYYKDKNMRDKYKALRCGE